MVDHFCAAYGFLKHFDTKIIYMSIFEWVVDHFCAAYGFLKHFDTKIIYMSINRLASL